MSKSSRKTSRPGPLPAPPPRPVINWRVWAPLAIVGVTALAYHNTFAAPFIFDDVTNIRENPEIRTLWPLWDIMWSEVATGVAGRPVAQLSFALNYAAGGLDVTGYHA